MSTMRREPDPAPDDLSDLQQSADSVDESAGLLARLERAAGDVDDHREAYRAAAELRDELVIEAHDRHAMTATAIARAARLSLSRVTQILASH